jgi:hypothetical protein
MQRTDAHINHAVLKGLIQNEIEHSSVGEAGEVYSDEEDGMADQRPTSWAALLTYLREGSTAILTWLGNRIGGR